MPHSDILYCTCCILCCLCHTVIYCIVRVASCVVCVTQWYTVLYVLHPVLFVPHSDILYCTCCILCCLCHICVTYTTPTTGVVLKGNWREDARGLSLISLMVSVDVKHHVYTEDASWPEKVENAHMLHLVVCPIVIQKKYPPHPTPCLTNSYTKLPHTPSTPLQTGIHVAQLCWFALYWSKGEKGWLVMYLILLPHSPALFMLPGAKKATLRATLSQG